MTDIDHREWLVQKRIDEVVQRAHALIFADDMSAAESRFAWLRVIEKMIESVKLDQFTEVTKEWLGLTK